MKSQKTRKGKRGETRDRDRGQPQSSRGRGPTPMPSLRSGTVKWFDDAKGFGFIAPDDGGKDIFVHFSGIQGDGRRTLRGDQKVFFKTEMGEKGLKAVSVNAIG